MALTLKEEINELLKTEQRDNKIVRDVTTEQYTEVVNKLETTFVRNQGSIHHAAIETRIIPRGDYRRESYIDDPLWYCKVRSYIKPIEELYWLVEDKGNNILKYYLYRTNIEQLSTILQNCKRIGDWYLTTDQFAWMIAEDSDGHVVYTGF